MDPAAAPGDEAGTKLDLARAYLDMGDADMAKSLLNEVAQQGNDAQKKEADELLKRASA
jgi:pilus assembly protein FimV